jgi:hypothetical protein
VILIQQTRQRGGQPFLTETEHLPHDQTAWAIGPDLVAEPNGMARANVDAVELDAPSRAGLLGEGPGFIKASRA